eukprot:UN1311
MLPLQLRRGVEELQHVHKHGAIHPPGRGVNLLSKGLGTAFSSLLSPSPLVPASPPTFLWVVLQIEGVIAAGNNQVAVPAAARRVHHHGLLLLHRISEDLRQLSKYVWLVASLPHPVDLRPVKVHPRARIGSLDAGTHRQALPLAEREKLFYLHVTQPWVFAWPAKLPANLADLRESGIINKADQPIFPVAGGF